MSHVVSWADKATYTMRPRPAHAWAAAHIGQCSPDVYTVAAARSPGDSRAAAQRSSSNPG
ncbi:hypothetical protein ABZ137_01140 [Streptomyces bobili]|uniref:hypothetical protein n=1 Tax=Streptomyces bobili TaxID=67280 RepID=UPI0033BA89AE